MKCILLHIPTAFHLGQQQGAEMEPIHSVKAEGGHAQDMEE